MIEETFYNADGSLSSVKDGNGNITNYQYDDFGRQVKVIYPDGSYTEIQQFDVLGRAVQYRDRSGTIFTAQYDALGRKTSRTVVGGDSYAYGYDIMDEIIVIGSVIAREAFEAAVLEAMQEDAIAYLNEYIRDTAREIILSMRGAGAGNGEAGGDCPKVPGGDNG